MTSGRLLRTLLSVEEWMGTGGYPNVFKIIISIKLNEFNLLIS